MWVYATSFLQSRKDKACIKASSTGIFSNPDYYPDFQIEEKEKVTADFAKQRTLSILI